MTAATLDLESGIAAGAHDDKFDITATALPSLTLLAIEEPENNLSPYFLSRVVQQLIDVTRSGRAQAVISSHSASTVARIEPEKIRHFRVDVATRTMRVNLSLSVPSLRSFATAERVTVLVLTGYRAQCVEIERAIRRLDLNGVAVTVNTVDAVQGREADVVIFSVTRSNLTGEFGFLDERYSGRINVALSRAREILWIVGDSEFAASKDGPLRRALGHIERSGIGRIEFL